MLVNKLFAEHFRHGKEAFSAAGRHQEGICAEARGQWLQCMQGAMNFSGYELAKKALSQQEHTEPKELQLQPSHAA